MKAPGTQHQRRRQAKAVQILAERVRSEHRQIALRGSAAGWASRLKPNYFVTLTFASKEGVSFIYADTVFGRFVRRLRSALYGSKSKKRLSLFPVVEGHCPSDPRQRNSGVHIHFLINLERDASQLQELVATTWRQSGRFCGDPKKNDPSGNSLWFKCINNEEDASAYTGYIVKTCRDNIDAVLIDFVHIPSNDLRA